MEVSEGRLSSWKRKLLSGIVPFNMPMMLVFKEKKKRKKKGLAFGVHGKMRRRACQIDMHVVGGNDGIHPPPPSIRYTLLARYLHTAMSLFSLLSQGVTC